MTKDKGVLSYSWKSNILPSLDQTPVKLCQLVMVFRVTNDLWAVVLGQVRPKYCRILALQEQVYTEPLKKHMVVEKTGVEVYRKCLSELNWFSERTQMFCEGTQISLWENAKKIEKVIFFPLRIFSTYPFRGSIGLDAPG